MHTYKTLLASLASLFFLASGCAGGHAQGHVHGEHRGAAHRHHGGVHHDFSDVERWAREFEDPSRDAWQKPDEVVRALGIDAGSTVADIGAGSGYFAVRFARQVGAAGRVLAVEIEPNWIGYLQARAVRENLPNLVPVLAAADDPRLHPGSVDLAFICDTYHHIENRVAYLRRVREALRPNGRIAIVDFKPGDLPVGPPPEARLPIERVEQEMAEAGFTRVAAPDLLPYQYVAVFRRTQ